MMTPDEHREIADRLVAETGAMKIDTNPVLLSQMTMLALTHALLAQSPATDLEPVELHTGRQSVPVTPLGLLALVVIFGSLVAVAWILAG